METNDGAPTIIQELLQATKADLLEKSKRLHQAAEATGQNPERFMQGMELGWEHQSPKVMANLGAEGAISETGADPVSEDVMPLPKFNLGQSVYLDGRDPDATPPLTIRRINIWNAAERTKVLRMLRHGTRVKVINREFAKGRWHYRIRHKMKPGWVAEAFLCADKPDVLGDLVL